PRDHFEHPDYQTEWWYYTGNLWALDGHRFGFELTFFRVGLDLPPQAIEASTPVWTPKEIYIGHLALSDIDGHEFYHTERTNRVGPGLAGASFSQRRYWNGNWQVTWTGDGQHLEAVCDQFTLELNLTAMKSAVVNGQRGVIVKGAQPGSTSHYISLTRLSARGTLNLMGNRYQLSGQAWMDHEFFTSVQNSSLEGWDWFAIQLDNNRELMLYRVRDKSGKATIYSSGTYVQANNEALFLPASAFLLQPAAKWQSASSHVRYPIEWHISVPELRLELNETPALRNQELFNVSGVTPSYWEGAVNYSGTLEGAPVHGVGYLEMTGHDRQVWLAAK
ncbi:MAG: hypothetical protein JO061_22850, partial [Acidobacteriaceae bacterium]|nr:hypothetical protein [Acidobacteriaceae bacterium]